MEVSFGRTVSYICAVMKKKNILFEDERQIAQQKKQLNEHTKTNDELLQRL